MKCPNCGYPISRKETASALGSKTSDAKTLAARENGTKKPHFAKAEHFESLGLFPTMECNEWRRKIKLRDGRTVNPDYYVPESDLYIEVATSLPNISEQRSKWRKAMNLANVRVFWWEGEELTEFVRKGGRSPARIVLAAKAKNPPPHHTEHRPAKTLPRHPADSQGSADRTPAKGLATEPRTDTPSPDQETGRSG